MPLSTDVKLPRKYDPVFPDWCIVCGEKPDTFTRVAHNGMSAIFLLVLPILYLFKWRSIQVPVCRACKPKFLWQRWGRTMIWLTIAIGVAAIFVPFFMTWSPIARRIAVLGIMVIFLIPYFVMDTLWPRIFDVSVNGDEIEYEFKSKKYAVEFAAINDEHVLAINYAGEDEDKPAATGLPN